jgi:hypothetical protein
MNHSKKMILVPADQHEKTKKSRETDLKTEYDIPLNDLHIEISNILERMDIPQSVRMRLYNQMTQRMFQKKHNQTSPLTPPPPQTVPATIAPGKSAKKNVSRIPTRLRPMTNSNNSSILNDPAIVEASSDMGTMIHPNEEILAQYIQSTPLKHDNKHMPAFEFGNESVYGSPVDSTRQMLFDHKAEVGDLVTKHYGLTKEGELVDRESGNTYNDAYFHDILDYMFSISISTPPIGTDKVLFALFCENYPVGHVLNRNMRQDLQNLYNYQHEQEKQLAKVQKKLKPIKTREMPPRVVKNTRGGPTPATGAISKSKSGQSGRGNKGNILKWIRL